MNDAYLPFPMMFLVLIIWLVDHFMGEKEETQ